MWTIDRMQSIRQFLRLDQFDTINMLRSLINSFSLKKLLFIRKLSDYLRGQQLLPTIFYILNHILYMLNKPHSPFEAAKMQKNLLFSNSSSQTQYEGLRMHSRQPLIQTLKLDPQVEEVVDLEDLWNAVESGQQPHETGKIRVCILNVQECPQQPEETFEISEEEFQRMAEGGSEHGAEREEVVDLEDLWNQADEEEMPATDRTTQTQKKELPVYDNEPQETKPVEIIQPTKPSDPILLKPQGFDVNSLLSQSGQKSTNLNLQRDYLIYDYQSFVISCFETNAHSYFGFAESPFNRNLFHLYDLTTREPFLECCVDTYEQSSLRCNSKQVKVQYELQSCLKFRLPKNGQLVATAFHKYITNGILYNIKPFNHYENQYEDSLALVEITDGFIGSNCYCNTNVYISQKYTNQPGQLKMVIGVKNGFLIANMGVNGVKSAPYNCRLENFKNDFVYLLGMIDKESNEFIVRVGQGMSPLLAMAISIGRKRYIDSFSE